MLKAFCSLSQVIVLSYLGIFNKNTYIYERSKIEIDERENILDIFIGTYHFSLGKIHRVKNRFLTEIYKINWKCYILICGLCKLC